MRRRLSCNAARHVMHKRQYATVAQRWQRSTRHYHNCAGKRHTFLNAGGRFEIVLLVATRTVAKATQVGMIANFGIVLVAMLAVFWVVVAARTLLGAWRGDLFVAPCLTAGPAPKKSDVA
jgi:hypothetical protein